ncbi:MAG: hypothetical protein IJ146_12425 [Kiritimatiellae bacterium]|nr:hypothetical protein [Kiritimatiellia bacterium]
MASFGKILEVDGREVFVLAPETVVKGKKDSYTVVGRIAVGGFGATYKVRSKSDNVLAVLKMSADVQGNEFGGDRIRREAFVMRRCGVVDSRLIPCVFDEGKIKGRPFFVMENLKRLEWSSRGDDRLGLPDTEERRKAFFVAFIESVKVVHNAGFVHCDIKPDNIMERFDGSHWPILIDFGSAHPIEAEAAFLQEKPTEWINLTSREGKVAYTPGYYAPEDAFTIQKDIFAIGQVIRDSFDKDVPFEWMEIIGRCISRKAKYRYDCLDDLKRDIEKIEKLRMKRYWGMRNEKIVEQRRVERSLAKATVMNVGQDVIPLQDEKMSNEERTVLRVVFPTDKRLHYIMDTPLRLNENTILIISGEGILEADVRGPSSSVVVLQNYAIFHNTSVELPPENDLTYVIVGPGSYLNFPNLKSDQYWKFFPGRKRILRDIDATTSFRFGGPTTFSGVEDETLRAISESSMPQSYKGVLSDFFSGRKFTVEPK